jgi:hypothetical protein
MCSGDTWENAGEPGNQVNTRSTGKLPNRKGCKTFPVSHLRTPSINKKEEKEVTILEKCNIEQSHSGESRTEKPVILLENQI